MNNKPANSSLSVFEKIKQINEDGIEFWSARDISKALDYTEFRNFKPVIEKAKEACKNSGEKIENHFVDFHEMVKIGSGVEKLLKN